MKKSTKITNQTHCNNGIKNGLLKLISWITLIAFLNLVQGCMNYFKVKVKIHLLRRWL